MRQASNLLAARAMPRAILGHRVQASTPDVLEMLGQIKTAQTDKFGHFEAALNSHAAQLASLGLNGGGTASGVAPDPTYTATFANWFRNGDDEAGLKAANNVGERRDIRAALNEGSNSDGGYLTPTEWDRNINQSLIGLSPLRRLCDVKTTTVGAYLTLWKLTGPGTGWVGETAERPATGTPTFAPLVYGHGEIFANAFATQRMLDDASFDAGGWLTSEIDTEFAKQEAIAFLTGNGVNKPNGILLHGTGGQFAVVHPAGAIQVDASGSASGLTVDGLIDFTYRLPAPYRQASSWLMNSNTAAVIAKMKDGQGNLIWRESLIVGQPSTLLGRPVELDENMPSVGAGTTPIIFGSFKAGYIINDRQGMKTLRDPYTSKPYVSFYCTKRVGGGVKDPAALRILKIAAA